GEPPFAVEGWAGAVHADLARMPTAKQKPWRELFAAWDEAPPPYATPPKWRDAAASRLRGVDDAASLARAWLSAVVRSWGDPRDPPEGDDRVRRNVAVLDGLFVVAESENGEPRLDLLRSIVRASFAPLPSGGARCPRLGYRAADALARLGESDTLRQAAA